ncbi:MAG: glycosyltransferase [Candidatus Eremiobacteraeota bacterium]|nr:glycosyltransferase [Candidatus Eremiobacteraeota bacterium]
MPIHVRSKRHAAPLPAETAAAIQPGGELPFGLPRPSPSRVQKPPGISLCMIVKNEERFLRQCLDSVKDVVDEMIVVDTGSTDTTMEIARSYGAHVIQRPWRDDFAWARNQALEAATKRWILVLDADEELLVESIPALRQLKTVPAEHTALWARLHNKSDDYRGTGAMSHALIRVFPNTPEIRYKGLIHEYPTVDGSRDGLKGMTSPVTIVHHGYVKEIVNAREKGARNLAMVRAATEQEPEEAFNWFNLGSTAFMVNDYETARDALERMRSMVGKERRGFMPNGLAVLAETYCDKMDDPVRGEEVARHALEIAPHYANAHFQLGKALVAQGRLDEARDAYLAAIDDERYAAEQFVLDDQVYVWKAHSEIGSTYVIDKNDEKALEWFEKGLKNAPNAEPLHVNRARALERLGRLDEAGSAYRAVYELHRSDDSGIEYVNYLLRRGRDREALNVVDECYASAAPEKAVPLLMAAAAVAQRQKSPDDERYLKAAARAMPGASEVLDPLEALLRERGKEGEIAALIEREDREEPRGAGDFARRARRAIEQKRPADGLTLARRGLESAPGDPLLAYTLAAAQAQLGEEEPAIATLERIENATQPLRVAALTLRAGLLHNRERYADAAECIREALQLEPQNADAMRLALELSAYYLKENRFAEAAAIADFALQH